MIRNWICAAAGALACCMALAQGPTSRPLKLVVPYSGGAVDILARMLGERLAERLGRPVVVENRPGASGILGVQSVAKSTDGETLLITNHSTIVINPFLYSAVDRMALQGLVPVSMMAFGSYLMVANPRAGIRTLADLVQKARANPGKLSYGSYGVGSGPHLCMEMLQAAVKISLLHVPYRTTPTPDLIGGQLTVSVEPVATSVQFVKEGRLAAIAFTDVRQPDILPGIPAVHETVPGYRCDNWVAMFAPASMKGTNTLAQVGDAVREIMALPEIRKRVIDMGAEAKSTTAEGLTDVVTSDLKRWGTLIRQAGIKVE